MSPTGNASPLTSTNPAGVTPTMDGMSSAHARPQRWTGAELFLAYAYALLCPAIGFFAFVEIYQTATHLVHPWFGDWAWIVPLSAEGMFTALYCGWVLLELRDDPPARVRVLLGVFLAACGAASYALQILAARGIVADALAHAIVVTAFFGVLIFGKVLVRRLKVTPAARALEAAMADARQHAIDLVRDRKGRLWRFGVPSLLRRQILARPAARRGALRGGHEGEHGPHLRVGVRGARLGAARAGVRGAGREGRRAGPPGHSPAASRAGRPRLLPGARPKRCPEHPLKHRPRPALGRRLAHRPRRVPASRPRRPSGA